MLSRFFTVVTLTTAFALSTAQQFQLAKDYSGPTFFDGFLFNDTGNIDVSGAHGNVHCVNEEAAMTQGLTSFQNGRAIVKVDNTTVGNPADDSFGRNTVYLQSNDPVKFGSLILIDAEHMPFGCSVWPAFFTQGKNWPSQGEIDIIENVNRAPLNRYALHTGDLCAQPTSGVEQTGSLVSAPFCNVTGTDNVGCVVQEKSTNSFGQGFASTGGGVYATLWDADGIKIWFFERSNIPSKIDTNPDPSSWPTPSAFYPSSSCNPSTSFGDQTLTLYTNICGAFAGDAPGVFAETCSDVASSCLDLVRDPANYNNAYWEINYIRVFTGGNTDTSTIPPTSLAPTSSGRNVASQGTSSASAPVSSNTGGSETTTNQNSGMLAASTRGTLQSLCLAVLVFAFSVFF